MSSTHIKRGAKVACGIIRNRGRASRVGLPDTIRAAAAELLPTITRAVSGREAGKILLLKTIPGRGVERACGARNLVVIDVYRRTSLILECCLTVGRIDFEE